MAGYLDPNAIYGWCGQGEERRLITYPDPTWYDDPEQAIENDPAAAYCFRRARDHCYFQGVRYAAPPWPDSNPFRRPRVVAAAPPPPTSSPPLPSTPRALSSLSSHHGSVPAPAAASALLPPQPVQHGQPQHQQQQQQTVTRAPPQWGPPPPGQRIDRYDRFFGCLHCQWTGDRERKAVEHVERAHRRAQGQKDVDWVDWGHIKPRFK